MHWQLWKRDEKGTSTEDLVNAAGWERFCRVATVPGNPLDERHHCIALQHGGASKSPTFREAFIYFIFLYATLSEELVWRCLKMLKVQRLEDHTLSLYKITWWLQEFQVRMSSSQAISEDQSRTGLSINSVVSCLSWTILSPTSVRLRFSIYILDHFGPICSLRFAKYFWDLLGHFLILLCC